MQSPIRLFPQHLVANPKNTPRGNQKKDVDISKKANFTREKFNKYFDLKFVLMKSKKKSK